MLRTVNLDSDDLYERLGLELSASSEEIKRAYRALLREYPPERAPEEFKRLREAYETLGNPGSREEYDRRPDPVVARWLDGGLQAMKADQHDVAERYFKQVLLQQPDLSFVRNLLGLCFLYQGESAKAATQFEKLLTQPDAPAAWFGNAGHAYGALGRHADAEKAFQEAVRRATDSPVDYIIGLVDLYIDQGKRARAAKALDDAIKADGVIDFQDLRYFTKLLEIRILEQDFAKVDQVLRRMKSIATDEEQRRYVAWKVGSIGQRLVRAHAFTFAIPVARLARELQPNDPDYSGLEDVATQLGRNDFAGAGTLLRTHVSFQAGEWLAALGGWARGYIEEHRVFAQMEPIAEAPSLRTINGFGTTIYGEREHDPRTGSYVTTLYFVALFIPVFPIACYRVVRKGGGWSFLGKVPFSGREKAHWKFTGALAFAAILIMLASNGSGQRQSTYLPPVAPAVVERAPSLPSPAPDPYRELVEPGKLSAVTYRGSVTNSGLPDQPGSLEIGVDGDSSAVSGHVKIGPPLGGSGQMVGQLRGDTLYLMSISIVGDTIFWLGMIEGDSIQSGRYAITGGVYKGQDGVWTGRVVSGLPLKKH